MQKNINSEEALGKGNIWSLIFKMSIPCILAQIVNLLYNIIDRIYIGNMEGIGNDALAGLGLCSPIIILISAFAAFAYGGGAPLSSRALGEGNKEKAEKILGNSTFLLLLFSIILTLVAFIFKKDILFLVGASENTFDYANNYLSIYLIGTIFVQVSVGLNSFITAQGKSTLAMITTLIGAVLNILLDPIFIFTFNMGIEGAALATIISQAISAIWILFVLLNKNTSLRLKVNYIKPNIKTIGSIMSLGVANFVMASTESIIGFVLNGQLKKYGGDIHVSNLTILQSAMMLITIPISGFVQGVTPILSYNFGANNKERLKSCYFKALITTYFYCATFALVMILFPTFIGKIFTQDEELLLLVQTYMPIFVSGMLIFGIQRACQTAFVAMGEAVISLFIAILRKILLLVPLAYLFPTFMGVSGVYYAECTADITAAIICGTIFIFRFRKILKKMNDNQASSYNC